MSMPYMGHCEHLREGWCIACIAPRWTPEPDVLETQRKVADCEYEWGHCAMYATLRGLLERTK
jgi:hypothetical protein